jgi:hypothetical protein
MLAEPIAELEQTLRRRRESLNLAPCPGLGQDSNTGDHRVLVDV